MPQKERILALGLVILLCLPCALLQSTATEGPLRMRTDLSTSYASFIGEDGGDNSGISVAIVGDVNGDAFDDILIGAAADDDGGADAGQAYLFFGNSTGWAMDVDLSNADASFVGENAGDNAGISVAGAGDVNRDGFDDMLIGAHCSDDNGGDAGQVYIILGKATGWAQDTDLSASSASFLGESVGDVAGTSVAGAGDVNADGYDDIIIGAINDDDGGFNAGQAYLILGKSAGWAMDTVLSASSASFWGESAGDNAGRSVAGAGDINRDGYDDILVGAPGDDDGGANAGQSYIIFGKATGWAMDTDLSAVDASYRGENGGDNSGYSLASAGDVNGDGYDDIIIGAYGDDDGGNSAGQSYLILGKALGWAMDINIVNADASFWGEIANDESGRAVAPAGDVNGDGYDDVLIGSAMNDVGGNNAGQTYLILGRSTGWVTDTDLSTAEASFIGEDGGDYSGTSVAGGGDVNGDGLDDILIGANGDDDGGIDAGQTYLMMAVSAPPPPQGLKASLTGDGGPITLNWSKPEYWREPFSGFRVYRSMDGDHYNLLASLPPSARSYVDSKVELGKVYHYGVETVDASGDRSGLTKIVSQMCDNDTDLDGLGNLIDLDDDGDGVPDGGDAFPLDISEWLDTDIDGIGNSADTDDDNDGIPDISDTEPLNPLNSLRNDLQFLNTTLNEVKDIVLGLRANLTFMNSTLGGLNGNITSMNASLSDMMSALSNDIQGMNSTLLAAMAGMNSTLLAAMAGMNSSVIGALAVVNTSVLSALSQVNTSVQNALAGLNSSLLSELSLLNDSIRSALVDMNSTFLTELSAVNSSLQTTLAMANSSILSTLSGMNNSVLTQLAAVNSTVLAQLAGVNSSILSGLASVNNSILSGLDGVNSSLQSHLSSVNSSLAALLGDISNELSAVNGSLTSKLIAINSSLSKIGEDISGLNGTLRADHQEIKDLLANINTNITTILSALLDSNTTKVISAIKNLSAQISDTNTSLQQGIVDLEVDLGADIQALQLTLDAANSSLHSELGALGTDMLDFRADVTTSLNIIIDMLKAIETNQSKDPPVNQTFNVSKEITELETLIENINSTTLTQITNKLEEIENAMPSSGTDNQNISKILAQLNGLTGRVETFRTETLSRLDNITKLLKALDRIDNMAGDISNMTKDLVAMKADLEKLDTIETQLTVMKKDIEDLKDEESKTRNAVTVSSTGTPIAIILLLVLVMVMIAVNILRTRDLKAQSAGSKKRMDEGFAEVRALRTETYSLTTRVKELANRPIPEPQIRYIESPRATAPSEKETPGIYGEPEAQAPAEAAPEEPSERLKVRSEEPKNLESKAAESESRPKDKDEPHGDQSIDVILKKLKKHKR